MNNPRGQYRPDGYAHRHVTSCPYGSAEYYEHKSQRMRGTIQVDDGYDSRMYVYRCKRGDADDFKRWFEGTYGGRSVAVKGRFPLYYVVRF